MKREIEFTKMHGTGNDYIYINVKDYPILSPAKIAVEWSQPHTGIGSDGVVLINKSKIADFSMRIFNSDGSEAMMCGNASRCIGKYVFDNGLTDKQEITLETLSGIKTLKLHIENGKVHSVTVDMGNPQLQEINSEHGTIETMIDKEIHIPFLSFNATAISMGNPHLVIFTDDIDKIDLSQLGPQLENHKLFPERINVEFAQIISKTKIRMRVWERGSGITKACGTGACATAVAGVLTNRTDRNVEVIMDGGTLQIKWDKISDKVFMTGDAVTVFEGKIELEE